MMAGLTHYNSDVECQFILEQKTDLNFEIDCEMVGSGNRSILARVSIVDEYWATVLDEYVKPTAPVTDYRTCVSGIKRAHLNNAQDFATVQRKVQSLIKGCILIGHSLDVALDALGLSHPEHNRRDLAKYEPFKRLNYGQPASLQYLARQYLGKCIQEGEHDSVQDAKACMDIYFLVGLLNTYYINNNNNLY